MNLFYLTLAYLRANRLSAILNTAILGLGLGTVVFLLLAGYQAERRLSRDAGGIHLVIGAPGSRLQLVLAALYHADIPSGNIPFQTLDTVSRHPLVAKAIPLALGDSFAGFRIVGTEPAYASHYGAELAQGRIWREPMEAVLGAEVARVTGMQVGQNLTGSHGLTAGGSDHQSDRYRVTGILRPTGTILDRLILTPVESLWLTHGIDTNAEPEREITAILASFRAPVAAATVPEELARETGLTTAAPAREMARLLSLLGLGLDAFRGFGVLLIAVAGLGIFVALYNALRERKGDMAVMRSLGASPRLVFAQLVLEALLLTFAGYLVGLALGHSAAELLPHFMPRARELGLSGSVLLPRELMLLPLALGLGLAASIFPAWQAYRIPITRILARS